MRRIVTNRIGGCRKSLKRIRVFQNRIGIFHERRNKYGKTITLEKRNFRPEKGK